MFLKVKFLCKKKKYNTLSTNLSFCLQMKYFWGYLQALYLVCSSASSLMFWSKVVVMSSSVDSMSHSTVNVALMPTWPQLANVESSSATSRFSSFSFVRGDQRVTPAVRNYIYGIRRTQHVSHEDIWVARVSLSSNTALWLLLHLDGGWRRPAPINWLVMPSPRNLSLYRLCLTSPSMRTLPVDKPFTIIVMRSL